MQGKGDIGVICIHIYIYVCMRFYRDTGHIHTYIHTYIHEGDSMGICRVSV